MSSLDSDSITTSPAAPNQGPNQVDGSSTFLRLLSMGNSSSDKCSSEEMISLGLTASCSESGISVCSKGHWTWANQTAKAIVRRLSGKLSASKIQECQHQEIQKRTALVTMDDVGMAKLLKQSISEPVEVQIPIVSGDYQQDLKYETKFDKENLKYEHEEGIVKLKSESKHDNLKSECNLDGDRTKSKYKSEHDPIKSTYAFEHDSEKSKNESEHNISKSNYESKHHSTALEYDPKSYAAKSRYEPDHHTLRSKQESEHDLVKLQKEFEHDTTSPTLTNQDPKELDGSSTFLRLLPSKMGKSSYRQCSNEEVSSLGQRESCSESDISIYSKSNWSWTRQTDTALLRRLSDKLSTSKIQEYQHQDIQKRRLYIGTDDILTATLVKPSCSVPLEVQLPITRVDLQNLTYKSICDRENVIYKSEDGAVRVGCDPKDEKIQSKYESEYDTVKAKNESRYDTGSPQCKTLDGTIEAQYKSKYNTVAPKRESVYDPIKSKHNLDHDKVKSKNYSGHNSVNPKYEPNNSTIKSNNESRHFATKPEYDPRDIAVKSECNPAVYKVEKSKYQSEHDSLQSQIESEHDATSITPTIQDPKEVDGFANVLRQSPISEEISPLAQVETYSGSDISVYSNSHWKWANQTNKLFLRRFSDKLSASKIQECQKQSDYAPLEAKMPITPIDFKKDLKSDHGQITLKCETDTTKSEHDPEGDEVKSKYESEYDPLKSKYQSEQIKSEYESEGDKVKSKYEPEHSSVKSQIESEYDPLKSKYQSEQIKSEYESEGDKVKSKYEPEHSSVKSQIESEHDATSLTAAIQDPKEVDGFANVLRQSPSEMRTNSSDQCSSEEIRPLAQVETYSGSDISVYSNSHWELANQTDKAVLRRLSGELSTSETQECRHQEIQKRSFHIGVDDISMVKLVKQSENTPSEARMPITPVGYQQDHKDEHEHNAEKIIYKSEDCSVKSKYEFKYDTTTPKRESKHERFKSKYNPEGGAVKSKYGSEYDSVKSTYESEHDSLKSKQECRHHTAKLDYDNKGAAVKSNYESELYIIKSECKSKGHTVKAIYESEGETMKSKCKFELDSEPKYGFKYDKIGQKSLSEYETVKSKYESEDDTVERKHESKSVSVKPKYSSEHSAVKSKKESEHDLKKQNTSYCMALEDIEIQVDSFLKSSQGQHGSFNTKGKTDHATKIGTSDEKAEQPKGKRKKRNTREIMSKRQKLADNLEIISAYHIPSSCNSSDSGDQPEKVNKAGMKISTYIGLRGKNSSLQKMEMEEYDEGLAHTTALASDFREGPVEIDITDRYKKMLRNLTENFSQMKIGSINETDSEDHTTKLDTKQAKDASQQPIMTEQEEDQWVDFKEKSPKRAATVSRAKSRNKSIPQVKTRQRSSPSHASWSRKKYRPKGCTLEHNLHAVQINTTIPCHAFASLRKSGGQKLSKSIWIPPDIVLSRKDDVNGDVYSDFNKFNRFLPSNSDLRHGVIHRSAKKGNMQLDLVVSPTEYERRGLNSQHEMDSSETCSAFDNTAVESLSVEGFDIAYHENRPGRLKSFPEQHRYKPDPNLWRKYSGELTTDESSSPERSTTSSFSHSYYEPEESVATRESAGVPSDQTNSNGAMTGNHLLS